MKTIKQIFNNKKNTDILVIALIVFVLVLIVLAVVEIPNKVKEGRYIGREGAINNTVAVSGQGEVYVKPNLAMIEFTASTEASAEAGCAAVRRHGRAACAASR